MVAHAGGAAEAMGLAPQGLAEVRGVSSGRGPDIDQHWQLPSSGYLGWSGTPDLSGGDPAEPQLEQLQPQHPYGVCMYVFMVCMDVWMYGCMDV